MSNRFKVSVAGREATVVPDLKAAIQFIMENAQKKAKPRVEDRVDVDPGLHPAF